MRSPLYYLIRSIVRFVFWSAVVASGYGLIYGAVWLWDTFIYSTGYFQH